MDAGRFREDYLRRWVAEDESKTLALRELLALGASGLSREPERLVQLGPRGGEPPLGLVADREVEQRPAAGDEALASSDRRAPASRRGRESDPPPGERMLGPDGLTSGMSLDDWSRYLVTRMYVVTGRNQSETARRLGISWRRAGQWIDHTLLARWTALPAR